MLSLSTGLIPMQDDPVAALGGQVNMLWVVIGAILVIFMQAGFALVETGFCRAKHAAHVVSTNFAIFGLGFIAFFLVGFPLSLSALDMSGYFGGLGAAVGSPLIGSTATGSSCSRAAGRCRAAASTPACSRCSSTWSPSWTRSRRSRPAPMAERWKWGSFVIWGLFCGAIYYPLFAAWTWGGGWLSKTWDTMSLGAGYVDFAGSGVVHTVGGVAALAGAIVLGPRIGKFDKDGTPAGIPGHHIPMAMLGTFILLFGWFGFNAASTFAATDVQFADRRHEHGDRRRLRGHHRHALDHQAHRQARPGHDGQRHARRPRRHHGTVCVRQPGHGGRHRLHRRRPRHRGGVLRRAAS